MTDVWVEYLKQPFQKVSQNHLWRRLFFVVGLLLKRDCIAGISLRVCNFIKNRLQHRCLPVKYDKLSRAVFLQSTSGLLFLECTVTFCLGANCIEIPLIKIFMISKKVFTSVTKKSGLFGGKPSNYQIKIKSLNFQDISNIRDTYVIILKTSLHL